ncbi:MAG: hypothetical protein ABIE03_00685 [Patescibacteria group bacterium]|nr:hypothetical protein [Patescibacteria group bacterium]
MEEYLWNRDGGRPILSEDEGRMLSSFLREIKPIIERALSNLYGQFPDSGMSLREHRRDKCINNDSICNELKTGGTWTVNIVTSTDTGKNPDGSDHQGVPHGHTISVIEISEEWVAVIDISCAQFAPLNEDLDTEFLLRFVKRRDLEGYLQMTFGGGKWELEEWK